MIQTCFVANFILHISGNKNTDTTAPLKQHTHTHKNLTHALKKSCVFVMHHKMMHNIKAGM